MASTSPREDSHAGADHRLDAHGDEAQVVAFKSFLRTLVHEFAHHLDYELFVLDETFHTEGFYKRESSLANALLAGSPAR